MKLKKIISICISTVIISGVIPFNTFAVQKSVSITVGKGDSYNFNSIQKAVNSIDVVPTEKHPATISIAPGVYEEEIIVDKPYVKFVNNNKNDEVIITYDKANGHSDSAKNFGTDKTATVTVNESATGFEAHNITFKNSYNIGTENKQTQAVALETLADKVVLDRCKLIGRQDTLYLKGASKGQNVYGSANDARVYVNNCYIEGTVDFIFGDATAYFDNCDIYMVEYENGGHFTAPNTTLFNVGYVFNNCRLKTSDKFNQEVISKIDLGRPWQCDSAYPNSGSNTVYINCTMPELYNSEGFSLWDSGTIANKIRFMEYGSKTADGANVNLTQRAGFVKQLTEEQASYFNAYNILKGNDNWNPANVSGAEGVCDVTLNSYDISVPKGEIYELKAIPLPMGREDAIKYTSDNEAIASIDENGVITANSEGVTTIYAILSTGLKSSATIKVTAPRTEVPVIKNISIASNNSIMVGNVIKAEYTYSLASDNSIDAAKIRWYAVKDGKQYLIKEGVGDNFKSYSVQTRDIGYNIKIEVLPATATTYGIYGQAAAYTTTQAVTTNVTAPAQLLRENFDKGTDGFTVNGVWNKISNGYNEFVTANSSSESPVSMFYNDGRDWDNISFEGRFRFNPEGKGLDSDGYFNIYFDYSEKSYYRLNLGRGSNTKSLKLYLYKKSANSDEEALLAKDETSLKNNIYQNAGEENPYFTIGINKNKGNIIVDFKLENATKKLATLTAVDENPDIKGTIGFEAGGSANVVLIDSISVEDITQADTETKIRLFLLGDSTAKNYSEDDNTIGGWGEYLVNYLDDSVEIINKAEAGRSARSYLNQGRLKEVTDELTSDDYVFVQFGTNDQRTDDAAFMEHAVVLGEPDENGIYPTIPAIKTKTPQSIYDFYKDTDYPYQETFYPYESGTFKWYMKQHIDAIKNTGATPVLLTPMCRMFFDSDGKITPHFGDNDGYIIAIRQLAEEEGIMCLDMYEITKSLYESYGILTTQGLHNIKSDGTIDLTHYNKFGANLIASKMADDIKANTSLPISNHIVTSTVTVEKTTDLKTANLFVVGGTAAAGGNTDTDYSVNADGFGNYLQKYLSNKITVKNMSVPKTTAKSYADTPEYNNLMAQVQEGDYVILSFGNDDGKFAGDSYSTGTVEDKGSFAYYMYNNYIKPLHEKKAVIIALTPFADRKYSDGNFIDEANEHTDIVTKLVVDNYLYFVNMYNVSAEIYKTMGEEGSKVINAYDRKNGILSDTYSEFGADLFAKRILTNLKQSSISLKDYVADNSLNAVSKMTRADFVYMAMDAAGITGIADANFDDVTAGKYYYDAISVAKAKGLISSENNLFRPEDPLTDDLIKSLTKNIFMYLSVNGNLEDVYNLASGEISPEIGIWAIDRLYEELNK